MASNDEDGRRDPGGFDLLVLAGIAGVLIMAGMVGAMIAWAQIALGHGGAQ